MGSHFSQNKFISRPRHFGGIVRQLTRVFLNLEVDVDVCTSVACALPFPFPRSLSNVRVKRVLQSLTLAPLLSLFPLCLSAESLSARATFDLYAHKSRSAAAIYGRPKRQRAIELPLYSFLTTPFVLPFGLVNVPVSSTTLLLPLQHPHPHQFAPFDSLFFIRSFFFF